MIMEIEMEEIKNTREFADKVSRLLNQINRNNGAFEQACVKFFGVTSSQAGTLLHLPLKQTLRMNELSEASGVETSTMTRMVDQLVEKGLVIRQTDAKDRRIVLISLTPQGQKMHKELSGALAGFYTDSLDDITEAEREIIIQVLERLKTSIEKGLENCCNKYCNRQG
jgi:DNA-binding MarR family transcriptional regulator